MFFLEGDKPMMMRHLLLDLQWAILYKFISRRLYPKAEQFTKNQLKIFDSGFKYGQSKLNLYKRIGEFDWDKIDKNTPLDKVRKSFGI
jgi:hypothetical protein